MTCDVLLVDTLSTLRIEKGLISPSWVIGQMSGFLEQENIPFEVLFTIPQEDGQIDIIQENNIVSGKFARLLKEKSPKVVFFFHEPELIHLVFAVQQEVKKILPNAIFCAGGVTGNACPEIFLKRGFDYICGQDIFHSFLSLIDGIKKGRLPARGKISVPDTKEDLNHYPFVSKKFFHDVKPQWCFPNGHIETFGIITGSMGCTGGCAHCPNSAFWGTKWRAMSAERIFREISFQMELLHVSTFYLGDLNFHPNSDSINDGNIPHPMAVERMRCLTRMLEEHAPDTKFMILMRPDTLSFLSDHSPELLNKYLDHVLICFLGIESFSKSVLSGLNKKITKQMIRKAVKVLEKKDVSIIASFMVGSLYETRQTLRETEKFIMHELPTSTVPVLNIMTPYPGTKFYNEIKERGLLINCDINFYNGQHLVFKHPVFKEGELESRIEEFYYKFFTERYTG